MPNLFNQRKHANKPETREIRSGQLFPDAGLSFAVLSCQLFPGPLYDFGKFARVFLRFLFGTI
jgi:hypothetical protein